MHPQSIVTIAYASQLLQAAPDRIRLLLHQLGIRPAQIVNGKEHYFEADIERVRPILANTPPAIEGELQHRAGGIR